ncbi:MAG: DUF4185 domain-containing protein [Rhodococcus sp. (in: high G+C Gram-positive bacteria)]|nr:DUF4185 domain-containing protein [Rhodococcus sp. (in: high G+C Gram-positive bacteria)]
MRVRSRQIAVGAVLALAVSGLSALTAPTVSAEPCGGLGGPGSSPLFGSSGSAGMSGKNPQGPQGPLPRITGNTQSIAWVTGPQSVNNTYNDLAMSGTDLGISWDNGAGQILMAFGDTFGDCSSGNAQWRSNALFRSDKASTNLAQGIEIGPADPADNTSGAVVRAGSPNYAAEIISSAKLPSVEDTTIPTAAIAIGNTQYINYMSVQSWGTPGRWVTNYSATAKSTDNGQNWSTDPKTIRVNKGVTIPGFTNVHESQGKFQQSAYVLGRDGEYLYQFGTPNGRFGDAFVSRVAPNDIENLDAYEYSTQDPDPTKQWSKNIGDTVAIVKGPGQRDVGCVERLPRPLRDDVRGRELSHLGRAHCRQSRGAVECAEDHPRRQSDRRRHLRAVHSPDVERKRPVLHCFSVVGLQRAAVEDEPRCVEVILIAVK